MPKARSAFNAAAAAVGGLGFALLSLAGPKAEAAVRICGPRIDSGITTAANELEAKKAALAAWRKKAAVLGEGYDGWHVAAGKVLKCFAKNGTFSCMAVGNPCVIQQNPQQKPAGPERKGIPL